MAQPSTEIPRTFTMVLPVQILLISIFLFFTGISIYSWLYEGASLNMFIVCFSLFVFSFWWIRSIHFEITESGVSFKSGLYNRHLPWSDIRALSYRNEFHGTGGAMDMVILSNNPGSRHIKINRIYFAGNKLRDIILTIMSRVPDLKLDVQILKEFEKEGLIKKEKLPV